ncbi:NXPE family member 3-like [Glandiceps talaboti]
MELTEKSNSTVRNVVILIIGVFIGISFEYRMKISSLSHRYTTSGIAKPLKVSESSSRLAQSHPKKQHVSRNNLYPYKKYSSFAMDWIGVIEEFELSHSNLKTNFTLKKFPKALVTGKGSSGLFSSTASKLYLRYPEKPIKKGEYVHVIVESYDKYGNRRLKGGDFLQPLMFNQELHQRTAGKVIDHGNGTYSVYFYAAWKGKANIMVNLMCHREAVLFLNHLYANESTHHGFAGRFLMEVSSVGNTSQPQQSKPCSLCNERTWEDACAFINPLSLGRTAFVCEKPDNLSCDTLIGYDPNVKHMDHYTMELIKDNLNLFNVKEALVPVGKVIPINIADSSVQPELPSCGPDLPVPMSNGYWKNYETFIPLMCKSQQWTKTDIAKCVTGKYLHFYGDSTLLGRYTSSLPSGQGGFKVDGMMLGFRAGGAARRIGHTIFEADYIDTHISCTTYTPMLVINFAFHFGSWGTRPYLDRLFAAKLAMLRLFDRCPGSIVIIKLLHPRDNTRPEQAAHSSNYRFHDMNRMARRVFGGLGIRFLDIWDMVASHSIANDVHPPGVICTQEINLLFSYICPDMVQKPIF